MTDEYVAETFKQNGYTVQLIADQDPVNRQRWLAYIAGECGPNGGKK